MPALFTPSTVASETAAKNKNRESFLSQFNGYISTLVCENVSKANILKNIKNPFERSIPRKHNQAYHNLNSMLFCDPMTAMAATNCYGFELDDLKAAQAECIRLLEPELDASTQSKQNIKC